MRDTGYGLRVELTVRPMRGAERALSIDLALVMAHLVAMEGPRDRGGLRGYTNDHSM